MSRWAVWMSICLAGAACTVERSLGVSAGPDTEATETSEATETGLGETGFDVCMPAPVEDACQICTKESCCQALHDCTIFGDPCPCLFECMLAGQTSAECLTACGGQHDDGEADTLLLCVHAGCTEACAL